MSYLNPPRLHFAGRFQAAPSTVNNDPLHFNNATFQPDFQQSPGGWWNPGGDAAWRLIDCKVTSAWLDHDRQAAAGDPVLTCLIGDSDRAPPAKIVDLDPEQQMVSQIWGLEVRICRADGSTLLRGRFEPVAFMDIWDRASGPGNDGDIGAGTMFQSVLTDLEWADVSASPFLIALKQAAGDGLLSIKFNVDGYNMNPASADFTRGRVVGTIGAAVAAEPRHFVVGRHFMAAARPGGNFFVPAGGVNFCAAIVDAAAGKIILDLGNALITKAPGGAPRDIGTLALAWQGPTPGTVDTINYTADKWYETTAGVVTLPAGRKLTAAELTAIGGHPLVITRAAAGANPRVAVAEAPNGTYVRADAFVHRLNPGGDANVRLFASKWGQPYANAHIVAFLDPSQLQSGDPPVPPVGTPTAAVTFLANLDADPNGVAELVIQAGDPGTVRSFIDGQLYGVRPMLAEDQAPGSEFNTDPWEFISLLVWSGFAPDDPPTWYGSIQPIFQQYANLYPIMKPIVDLADYDSVCGNVRMLALAFGLPVDNPNAMPVTRDLSDAKRKTILRWLAEPGPDGKPRKGTPQPQAAVAAAAVARPAAAPPAIAARGGKAAAASRRLVLRNRTP